MANVVNGNTMKMDTIGDVLIRKNILITSITVVATANAAIFELQDSDGSTFVDKIRIDVDVANKTEPLDLVNSPMVFPNGVRVKTVTNCEATATWKRQGNG